MTGQYRYILDAAGYGNLDVSDYTNAQSAEETTPVRQLPVSRLGTPVFCWLDIEPGSYEDENGNTVQYEGFTQADGTQLNYVLMTVERQKRIVVTDVQGRNGSVKEYISDGDYQVNLFIGVHHQRPDTYPEDLVAKLIAITDSNQALKVNSWWLRQFGIYNLVVTDHSAPQEQGRQNTQVFQLNCLSDRPLELTGGLNDPGQDDSLSVTEVKAQGTIAAINESTVEGAI